MKKLRLLDLFSGIGGFSLGLERSGAFETVAFCEIDPFCQTVLKKHWPGVPVHSDITNREFVEGEADVICGGFPCQDISLAGEGAGLAGPRSGLWRELLRAIRLVRPVYAIVENVAALLGRGMGDVLGDLAEIGYDAEWHCIPASAVGAPHRRDRVWIVANPRGEQHEGDSAPIGGAIAEELSRAYLANSMRLDGKGIVPGGVDEERRQDASERSPRPCGDGEGWWSVEPGICRVAYGVPNRVDRLRGLGNAVVPQVVEAIGRSIWRVEAALAAVTEAA